MKDKVLIYGASGHGKVIIDIVEREGGYEIAGFLDDDPANQGEDFCGYPILGGFDLLSDGEHLDCKLILAIGDNRARKRLWEKLKELGYELACAVHPSAQIGRDVYLGLGSVLMANTAINSGTEVGGNVIVNTGASIDHDCVIEDYVHISPGAHLAGNVRVGELTHIGIGVSVVQGVEIGKGVVIGAGAAVTCDIPDNVTAVGVPAKVIKRHGDEGTS